MRTLMKKNREHTQFSHRLVFIGCGKQAKNIALCVHKNKDVFEDITNLELIGADPSKKSRDLFDKYAKSLFPTALVQIYDCVNNIYKSPDNSIVFICSPPSSHLKNLLDVKNNGYKTVVMEKPLATSKSDIEGISKLVKNSQISFCVQEQYLHSVLVEELVDLSNNPSLYLKKRLGKKINVSIKKTASFFSKERIKDLELKRHTEHIRFIELPHIIAILLFVFGKLHIEMFKWNDLHWNGNRIPGYKDGKCVLRTDNKVKHTIYLSNVGKLRRDIVIKLSRNFEVIFTFPGQLFDPNTSFTSSVIITESGKIVYFKEYSDDHLKTSIRRILCSQEHRGTLDLSIEVSNLITDLI